MKNIALICASSEKASKSKKSPIPAKDVFVGPNFKKAVAQGIKKFDCDKNYYILTSKYGLVAPTTKIKYYDKTIKNYSEYQKREWAEEVFASLKAKFDLKNTHFVIFGPSMFSKYLKSRINCTTLKYDAKHLTLNKKEQTDVTNKRKLFKIEKLVDEKTLKKSIPNQPGYFKVWCNRDALEKILNTIRVDFKDLSKYIDKQAERYCIYVEMSVKKGLQSTIDSLINSNKNRAAIENGKMSTFRQLITAIVGKTILDHKAADKFLSEMYIEIFPFDVPVNSPKYVKAVKETKNKIIVSNYLYLFNIATNKHPLNCNTKFKDLRRKAKKAAKIL